MTKLLELAFAEAGKLAAAEQDVLALRLLAELAEEDEFDRAISASAPKMAALANACAGRASGRPNAGIGPGPPLRSYTTREFRQLLALLPRRVRRKRERRTDCFGRTGRIPACISSVSTNVPPIYSRASESATARSGFSMATPWLGSGSARTPTTIGCWRNCKAARAGCHSPRQGPKPLRSFGTYGQMGGRNAIMSFQWYVPLLVMAVFASSVVMLEGWGMFVFALAAILAILLNRMSILAALGWFCGLLLILALLSPAISCREGTKRIACNNNLRQISLALYNYEKANGCPLSAYIAGKNGRPMHSWRVLILPYLGDDTLFKRYNLNEPWDGPNNKKLLDSMPGFFACPCDSDARSDNCTDYVAVVGSDAAWPGAQADRPRRTAGQGVVEHDQAS